MKIKDPSHGAIPVFCALILACLTLTFCTGCEAVTATYKAATSGYNLSTSGETGAVNDDAIVVNTEKVLNIALDTFNLFLKLERDNEQSLEKVSPKIHSFAESVRKDGKNWIKSAERAHDVYKANRTAENHANLVTAYKTLQSAIQESQKYITKHSGV